ncbi:hypothetical protein MBLNU13_g04857t1 [Cladosporium sp. NU13]
MASKATPVSSRKANPDENTLNIYYALEASMIEAHKTCSEKGRKYAEEAVHFAEVTVQQETEADDGDLRTDNVVLECCQDVLREAKAAAAKLETEEDSDEYLEEDLVIV